MGAILFAGCLAALIGNWPEHRQGGHSVWLLGGLVFSGVIRAAVQGMASRAGQVTSNRAKQGLRRTMFDALLPSRLLHGRLIGEDLRLAVDDIEAQEGLIARFAPQRLAAVTAPLLIAFATGFASWFSALILLATLIPFAAGMALAGMAGKAEADRQLLALSRMSGLFVDRIASLPVILSFGGEDRIARQIGDAAHDVAVRTMQILRVAFVSSACLEFFAALSVALVAVYCGFSLLGLLPFAPPERLTLQQAFFALALAPEFYLGMRRLAAAYHDKQQGEAAQRRIDQALARLAPHEAAAPMQRHDGPTALTCQDLVIEYDEGNRIGPVTAGWNGPGLHAVTGATGTGKSSLLRGLVGLAPRASGAVLLNGATVAAGHLQERVGWAGQNPLLLPGTLAENLTLGNPALQAVPDDLLAACGLAQLVAARGLDLRIDPRGSGLSGGERRRIGLIRAIASDRPILLLDEPTADLDPATAGKVIQLLRELAKSRLIIAATHDPQLSGAARSVVALP